MVVDIIISKKLNPSPCDQAKFSLLDASRAAKYTILYVYFETY
tara:strand:+ start:120653 stop:120781 length:129 start_codon:yes stop_codon:yes gene_type:complete